MSFHFCYFYTCIEIVLSSCLLIVRNKIFEVLQVLLMLTLRVLSITPLDEPRVSVSFGSFVRHNEYYVVRIDVTIPTDLEVDIEVISQDKGR